MALLAIPALPPATSVGTPRIHSSSTSSSRADAHSAVSPAALRAPTWQNLTADVANAPPARSGAAMAFDVRDGEVVLFGGFGAGSQALSGTWTYANGSWTHARTNASPPARAAAAMAYDPVTNQVVLFGGHGASGPLADTWTFSNGNWTNITPTTAASPPKRYDASFAWDVADQMAVLFGGRNYLGVLNDTWAYANGTWVNRTASAAGANGTPSQRYSASFGFDYSDDAVVLFGGDGTIAATGGLLGDTWWFRSGHWVLPTTASAPAARTGSAIAFDASEASLVLFGGQPSGAAPLNDAWTYANGNWSGPIATSGPAPNPRTGAALVAYSGPTPATSFVLLFGGSPTNASLSNDTWIFGSESIVGVFVAPSREGVDLLQNVTFSAVPVGGTPPYSYAWTGNPPPLSAGCGSPTAPTIRCQLPTLGKFGVWVNVSETSGGPATAGFGFVTVTAVPSIPSLTVKPFPYHLGDGNV
ncbi:MAG: hypothetical protein L3J86_05510, partial [Thermoplasmata archaeon]|nr:hypothetical protein [Thermoplasmata archaeon]